MEKETDPELIQTIEEFYLPRHLVRAIYDIGHIPSDSKESQVGVGFIDVADYTHLSRFLSPKENQILLNGLYTAFQIVLERHGGFLNKIEGDSMMFQFDDVIDSRLRDMPVGDRLTFIARELFYTCVEMQRVCILFNQAHDDFVEESAAPEAKQAMLAAFDIIKTLRSKDDISSTLFAFFQIRIRIGANVGEVTIGNFGPSGSKHWDVIGLPVINAKRMESTAPIGGLRISEEFYHLLEETGIANDYFEEFRQEAKKLGSIYQNIDKEELYRYREVVIQEKRGATYRTYSVQVYPALPESLARQAEELLNHGPQGALNIIEFFRYYRGNHFVIDAIEGMLALKGVKFRKAEILALIAPKQAKAGKTVARLSLFKILDYMDKYLDYVQTMPDEADKPDFFSYDQYMSTMREQILEHYEKQKKMIIQKTFFVGVIVQQVYASIESSIREYQIRLSEASDAEDAEEAEIIDEL
jgi:Adenylate cyclase, family 3 (some proteins contain HAMP domain)